jgi:thymidine kinase
MFRDPEFVMFVGPMFGSKSSRLLAALTRSKYQNKDIKVFKPKVDQRYSQNHIVTHGGTEWPAINVSYGQEILELSGHSDVIGVDEAFMIPGCADVLIELFKRGKTIFVSSIQLSATGQPFHEIKEMMPFATKIEVCPAVCPYTQRDAYYTLRKVDSESEIAVGGAESYTPACWEMADFMRKQ